MDFIHGSISHSTSSKGTLKAWHSECKVLNDFPLSFLAITGTVNAYSNNFSKDTGLRKVFEDGLRDSIDSHNEVFLSSKRSFNSDHNRSTIWNGLNSRGLRLLLLADEKCYVTTKSSISLLGTELSLFSPTLSLCSLTSIDSLTASMTELLPG